MQSIRDKAAIVGIGVSDISKDSGRTELRLACECIKAAVEDAGLKMGQVDGLLRHYSDQSDEHHVIRALGIPKLTFHGVTRWGAGASCALVTRAVMAVAAGVANNVVFFRSMNLSSKRRAPETYRARGQVTTDDSLKMSFYAPFGLWDPPGYVAMLSQRYMHDSGTSHEQLGAVAVTMRKHAATNPAAIWYERPIAMKDYMASEVVVDPLRAFDCGTEVDGAVALIVTTAERARDLKQKPVYIMSGAQAMAPEGEMFSSYQRKEIAALAEVSAAGKQAFAIAGVGPHDIDLAQLDDSFSPLVPMQLEALGFCDPREGGRFCQGDNISLGGKLPLNTSGGALGEGQLYGMNHIVEAVRQLRGNAANQVKGAEMALVASGASGPASVLIMRR